MKPENSTKNEKTEKYFADLQKYRQTPIGSAFSDLHCALNLIAPKIGKKAYEDLCDKADKLEIIVDRGYPKY
jgi:hypothetical protein